VPPHRMTDGFQLASRSIRIAKANWLPGRVAILLSSTFL
jgi:hypothetical protein